MKTENKAILSQGESSTFFRLFIPLLQSVNRAYGIIDDMEERYPAGRLSFRELRSVAQALWKKPEILDEYITARSNQRGLSDEDRRILEGWKHPVTATFCGKILLITIPAKLFSIGFRR